jgi:hypothetical protein
VQRGTVFRCKAAGSSSITRSDGTLPSRWSTTRAIRERGIPIGRRRQAPRPQMAIGRSASPRRLALPSSPQQSPCPLVAPPHTVPSDRNPKLPSSSGSQEHDLSSSRTPATDRPRRGLSAHLPTLQNRMVGGIVGSASPTRCGCFREGSSSPRGQNRWPADSKHMARRRRSESRSPRHPPGLDLGPTSSFLPQPRSRSPARRAA